MARKKLGDGGGSSENDDDRERRGEEGEDEGRIYGREVDSLTVCMKG